jgi:hypothetical protein
MYVFIEQWSLSISSDDKKTWQRNSVRRYWNSRFRYNRPLEFSNRLHFSFRGNTCTKWHC